MNIALISPSHVPFMIGGAERLWRDLCKHIGESTKHNVDIINLPAPEANFWEIIDSYRSFYNLNLDHFDMVISGKNPSWMVQHHNHVVYMLHPLRGVYDTYPLFHLPTQTNYSIPELEEIKIACDSGISTSELFTKLTQLKNITNSRLEEEIRIPSPFLRTVLHRLDANALKQVKKIHPISDTVKNRKEYFHGYALSESLPPPSGLNVRRGKAADYFLTYSRLDQAKRIDLIIAAFKKTSTKLKLKVAGEGPELEKLVQLARDDNRISFIGRLTDEQLIQTISNAYGVIFTPYQEDYGLVTIESLKAGKPVITTDDSGGPLDFVKDGVNGFIGCAEPTSLAKMIDTFAEAEDYTHFSEAAQKSVNHINWTSVVEKLTASIVEPTTARKRIAVFTTYPIYPPKGGGQARVFYLCRELEKEFKVQVLCLVDGSLEPETIELSDNLTIECIPASRDFSEEDWRLYQTSGIPTTDIAMSFLFDKIPEYSRAAKRLIEESDILVAEQCYVFPLLEKYGEGKTKVYNSQNVEITLKTQMLINASNKSELLKHTELCEALACEKANAIIYCSESDKQNMMSIYSCFHDKNGSLVENGADISSISYLTSRERLDLRKRLGIKGAIAIFIASWHEPNIVAVRHLSQIALQTPEVQYLVLGTVGNYFLERDEKVSSNIHFTGLVSVKEKDLLLQCANIGVNPMTSGSGTNIKMFDYMAAGLPIVSTEVGARGIEDIDQYAIVSSLEDFPEKIRLALQLFPNFSRRQLILDRYSWQAVGEEYRSTIRTL